MPGRAQRLRACAVNHGIVQTLNNGERGARRYIRAITPQQQAGMKVMKEMDLEVQLVGMSGR